MLRVTRYLAIALALVAMSSVVTVAQTEPLRVLQAGDGVLYVALGNSGWTIVPNPISTDDLATLVPSGELVGAIPAPFLASAPTAVPLQMVQSEDGALFLVQGGNAWLVIPASVSDDEVAALTLAGELGGTLTGPVLSPPLAGAPPPAPEPPPPPVAVPPTAVPRPPGPPNPQRGVPAIVSSLPRTGRDKAITDTILNAFHMALEERHNQVAGTVVTYIDYDDATAAKGNWDAAQEAFIANKAISDPDVVAYIGPLDSGAARVSIPILCSDTLGMLSPGATLPGLTKLVPGVEPNEPDAYYPNNCKGARNFARLVPSDELEGATPSGWPNQLGTAGRQWYARYKVQFNSEPDIHALYGYEAMNVVLDAMQRAGPRNRAGVRDAIMATNSYSGVLGTWSLVRGDITGLTAPLPGPR